MNKFVLGALTCALAFSLVTAEQAFGEAGTSTMQAGEEQEKTYGLFVAIGNPYPTILGVNAAYNFNKDLRASIGYGEVEVTSSIEFTDSGFSEKTIKAQTYAAGVQYMFLPTAVRGAVGVHAGYFSVSGDGEIEIGGFDKSTGYAYSNLGIDWTTKSGFNLGTGINVAFLGATGAGFYLNTGWYL